jgi:1-phosphofructokinase
VAPVMTLCPSPRLTVLVEAHGDDVEIHLHAGGQGYWNARMLAVLGFPVVMCGYFGGETGGVLKSLMGAEGVEVRAVDVHANNVGELIDARRASKAPLRMPPMRPSRHDLDSLYGVALASGLEAAICVLAGDPDNIIPSDMYGRLARDLHDNERTVVADLIGDNLRAVIDGGVDVVKISHRELVTDGWASTEDLSDIVDAVRDIAGRGVQSVVVSRAEAPAIVCSRGAVFSVRTPKVTPVDGRGAGDSMTAGIAAGLAQGRPVVEAVRLGAAAGALNATRRGLATGTNDAIERFVKYVEISPYAEGRGDRGLAGATPGARFPTD